MEEQMSKINKKLIINKLFRMLCWREENKHWQTLYDELLAEISLGKFEDDFKGRILLMIVPIKYYDFKKFRQTIFEVIDYVDSVSRI